MILTIVMYKSDKRASELFYVHIHCVHYLAKYTLKAILLIELSRFQGRLHLSSTLSTATKEVFTRAGKMTQWLCMHGDLSLNSRTHIKVEGKNGLHKVVF